MDTGFASIKSDAQPWWFHGVAYQIYVRSFADANGDGIGDIDGIISRLDYLQDLGIDAIWLNPCYPSPQVDHGYDVADYLNIDAEYGDLDTFDRLIAAANERHIRVLMDIVPNHCSNQHRWFLDAVSAGPGSAEREWFWFRDGLGEDGSEPPNNWRAWFGGPAWTRVVEPNGQPGQWYLHLFTPEQPDLNWNHEPVAAAFDDILRFWWDRGVAGFRIDAPVVVGKTPGLPDAPPVPDGTLDTDIASQNPHIYHRPEVHELFRRWRTTADSYEVANPGRSLVFIGETFAPSIDLVASYVRPDELHSTFNFSLLLNNWEAHRWFESLLAASKLPEVRFTWTLNNHDAQRNVSRYGHADAALPSSYTGNNLVNSLLPVNVAVGTRRARAMAWLLAFLPGPIFLYAGEELGLPEVLDLPDSALQDPIFFRTDGRERGRDGCRVPLPWTSDPLTNYGFSLNTKPAQPWMPQPEIFAELAADFQHEDPTSVLNSYKTALQLRKQLPDAPMSVALVGDVLTIKRGNMVCITNFGVTAVSVSGVGTPVGSSSDSNEQLGVRMSCETTEWFLAG